MLRDHEKFGDTYAQWGGSMYTIITRDTLNIRAVLSGQFKCDVLRVRLVRMVLTFPQLSKLAVAGMGVYCPYLVTEYSHKMGRPGKHHASY